MARAPPGDQGMLSSKHGTLARCSTCIHHRTSKLEIMVLNPSNSDVVSDVTMQGFFCLLVLITPTIQPTWLLSTRHGLLACPCVCTKLLYHCTSRHIPMPSLSLGLLLLLSTILYILNRSAHVHHTLSFGTLNCLQRANFWKMNGTRLLHVLDEASRLKMERRDETFGREKGILIFQGLPTTFSSTCVSSQQALLVASTASSCWRGRLVLCCDKHALLYAIKSRVLLEKSNMICKFLLTLFLSPVLLHVAGRFGACWLVKDKAENDGIKVVKQVSSWTFCCTDVSGWWFFFFSLLFSVIACVYIKSRRLKHLVFPSHVFLHFFANQSPRPLHLLPPFAMLDPPGIYRYAGYRRCWFCCRRIKAFGMYS